MGKRFRGDVRLYDCETGGARGDGHHAGAGEVWAGLQWDSEIEYSCTAKQVSYVRECRFPLTSSYCACFAGRDGGVAMHGIPARNVGAHRACGGGARCGAYVQIASSCGAGDFRWESVLGTEKTSFFSSNDGCRFASTDSIGACDCCPCDPRAVESLRRWAKQPIVDAISLQARMYSSCWDMARTARKRVRACAVTTNAGCADGRRGFSPVDTTSMGQLCSKRWTNYG
jgi:hypothetical protein